MSPESSVGPTDRPAGGAAFGATAHGSTRAMFAPISQTEAKAWVSFFTLAERDTAFAAEITRLFDTDPPLRRHHLALYLCGRACLCQHQARQQRRQRHGARIRVVTGFVVRHLLAGWAALKAIAGSRSDQQPLILPAIVWNDREAIDPQAPTVTPAAQAADLAAPAPGAGSPPTPSAALVH